MIQPLHWSEQKRANVAKRREASQHWFERAGLTALLAAAAGETSAAWNTLEDAVASDKFVATRPHMFEELAAAALITQHFDLVRRQLRMRYAYDGDLVVRTDEQGPHFAVVTWSIDKAASVFAFRSSLFASDFIEGVSRFWLRSFPLFQTYMESGHEYGKVALSLWDAAVEPGLTFCGDASEHYFLVPDPHFMSNGGHADACAHFDAHLVPWQERQQIAFWRGSTTGQASHWQQLPRVRLCEIAQANETLLDAGLSNIVQIVDPEAAQQLQSSGLIKPFVDWRNFDRYKYQIVIDGNSNAWPGLVQRLLTGSPVLKITSPYGYRQWYYDRLRAWDNYVPVAADMSDLISKIEWLRTHDDVAQRIGEAGRALACSLDYDRELASAIPTVKAAMRYGTYTG